MVVYMEETLDTQTIFYFVLRIKDKLKEVEPLQYKPVKHGMACHLIWDEKNHLIVFDIVFGTKFLVNSNLLLIF